MTAPKEGAGLLERCTPDWRLTEDPVRRVIKGRRADGKETTILIVESWTPEPDAQLVALAYDHALLLRALADGVATLTAGFCSEYGDKGWKLDIKDGPVTVLYADAAGCPALPTDEPVRAALRKVVGSNG